MAEIVILLGGYGVFGGKLSRRLVAETDAKIIVAGRSLEKAEAHCAAFGGIPLRLDRDGDLIAAFKSLRPFLVIDAAGPFQAYGADPYRAARTAIGAGAHYLDLADDADFVTGIAVLDGAARSAGVTLLSGASSVPAISAAALDSLVEGLNFVSTVSAAILPGNRAPRGVSVMRAILDQVGRPLRVWRGGRWGTVPTWGDLARPHLAVPGFPPLPPRFASRIGAPDLAIFPKRYRARSASFRAGLELPLMHLGLWMLAWPVRLGLLRSLAPLTPALKSIADRLDRFGSDRGGMLVKAIGRDRLGAAVERSWTLIAEAGDGPEIPPVPAFLLARKLLAGPPLRHGARPAVGELTLAETEAGLSPFAIRFGRAEIPAPPLLERVLGPALASLPPAWRRLAEIYDVDHFEGLASVERGQGRAAGIIAFLFGFPPAADSVAVSVEKRVTRHGERWTRRFGYKKFVSHLSRRPGDAPGILRELFGPFSFTLHLRAEGGVVHWPVESWRCLGVPMPRRFMPLSETREYVDAEGVFRFDVAISLPFAGPVVRYRGFLAPI